MKNVFAEYADAYWAQGLSIVPITPGTKQPPMKGWTGFAGSIPNAEKRNSMKAAYPEHGIGLLLGPVTNTAHQLLAIDVDVECLVAIVATFFPKGACAKRGSKGLTYFARTGSDQKMKSTTLKTANSEHAIDILANGKMTVLPPTIHPSEVPYQWTTSSLLEVGIGNLPLFEAQQLKILKCIVSSAHLSAIQSGEGTHEPILRAAAQLVAAGASDDEIKRIILAALPERYSGNTLTELPNMISSARSKGFDESTSEGDDTLAIQIVNSARSNGIELFSYKDRAYVSIPAKGAGIRTHSIRSSTFAGWLRQLHYKERGRAIGQAPMSDAIATLEAEALYNDKYFRVWNRVGEYLDNFYIDLGRDDGLLVVIGPGGWDTCFSSDVKFVRPAGMLELPLPTKHGSLDHLRDLLGQPQEIWWQILGFMIASLSPRPPYLGLMIEGGQGSGKSFLCGILKKLIDPNEAERLRLPDNERDLAIHAKAYWLLSYDNASGMRAEISDALCVIATGGGMATRKLYSDDELQVFSASRPFIINGISGYARRPDLLERAIHLRLEPMPSEHRRTEAELSRAFEVILPGVLGALYQVISGALNALPSMKTPTELRMADAARWIAAAEGALGVEQGTIIKSIKRGQDALTIERINEEPLILALQKILRQTGPFEGRMGDLFDKLPRDERNLPRSPSSLSTALERQRPSLEKAGILIEMLGRTNQGKRIKLSLINAGYEQQECEPLPF